MKSKSYQNRIPTTKFSTSIIAGFSFACFLLCSCLAQAQTLQLEYTFEDGPGTTTTDDPSSAIYPVTLNMVSASGSAVDLHGAAGSGVQNQGLSLNISTNPVAGNANGAYALTTANSTLGNLGVVSNFTATIWFKMSNLFTNLNNQGPRLFALAANGITDIGGVNSLGLQFGSGTGGAATFPANDLNAFVSTTRISPPIYYNFPTNVWLFAAMTYDSVSGNAYLYYGSEASPAKLYVVKTVGAGTNFDFSGSASLSIGNRISGGRDFPGWIDNFRLYTGVGDANFIENVRQASTPVVISNLTPDGSVLMSGTNTLSFTASSANGIAPSNIKVAVNGTDVSSSLSISGSSTSQNVTYTNLPVNPTLTQQANLNGVVISIQVTDNSGISTTNSYTYDAFSPANFTWECEDYDFGGGMYIDNPRYAFVQAPDTYYNEATPYVNLTDANDNGNLAGPNRVYRDAGENVETEYSLGNGNNGGNSIGELMRQKVLDALALDNTIRDVNVGYFDGGTGSGLPNWMNYTRTYPTGTFNVYLRDADGGGALSASFDMVNSGWGTDEQTTTNVGTFNMVNTGGWDSFAWIPLRDSFGNLIRVTLGGTNTFRLTAGNSGGGNVNFVMLTPANTNLPSITGIYPNGTNMFQPSSALTFTASASGGATISPSSITVQLTRSDLLGHTSVSNLTTANGLVVGGTSTSRTVSAPLSSNFVYTAVISVTDVNGNTANSTVSFDTLSPVYTWEAEDYDHDDGQFFDNPQVNAYAGYGGDEGVDTHAANIGEGTVVYRPSGLNTEVNGDAPRLSYIGTGFVDYDVGWNDSGNWGNYTRTYPAGTFNVYMRGANGSTGLGAATMSVVTGGLGTPTQTTTNLGTFTIPVTGGWQNYTWAPLRDSGGNLVKFTASGNAETLRVTSGSGYNANFYAFFPANTNLPAINNIYPDGTAMFQSTNKLVFNVASAAGISTNNIALNINGVDISPSSLNLTGSSTSWNASYGLQLNSTYTVTISVTDANGNSASVTKSFDTFSSTNYTWEAEDFDYNGGSYIDNPQTNAYYGLSAVVDVDTHQVNFAGVDLYRPNGMDTEINGDLPRAQWNYTNDYTVGYFSVGAWMNYTRHYPAGTYNVYGRLANGGGGSVLSLSKVIGGFGTTIQTTNLLGTFTVPNTAWESYSFIPLRDDSGNLVTVAFDGSPTTLQLGVSSAAASDCNANFLMLVSSASAGQVTLTASVSAGNIMISFPTQTGHSYQVEYKNNLTDTSWTPLGSPISGNDAVQSVSDAVSNTSRFYIVQIQ